MSESNIPTNNPVILRFQQSTYDRLCAVARACLNVDRSSIKCLKIRACFLLIGPTGSGKTHLARALAREMQVPFLSISVSDWIILGGSNRGSFTTWPTIMDFIDKSKDQRGAIIFLDELDKCHHDSNWNSFLRSEIFSLCDSRVPLGIQDMDSDAIEGSRISETENFLTNKTMIIAGAAFQGIWDKQSAPTMGFNPTRKTCENPELPDLAKVLPRELINRFSSEVFMLPELTTNDYRAMVETMAEMVPEVWRGRFLELGIARLDLAANHQKGARYLEEILLAAIVEERCSMSNFVPASNINDLDEEPENLLDLPLMIF